MPCKPLYRSTHTLYSHNFALEGAIFALEVPYLLFALLLMRMQGSLAFGAGSCAPASQFRGSDQVQTGSPGLGPPPNPELDFGSGSAPVPNLGPDLGPVH